jgi:hypothetical protein
MKETPKNKKGWRIWRRILTGLAILATLIAIFYAEEDWRGKRAWKNCKRELEAKGMVLDWEKFIPPPVPDDQNFFKAPKMTAWFVGRNTTNDLYLRMNGQKFAAINRSVGAGNLITTVASAKEYLAWSDQFEPDFDTMREALKRPYAWMDGDYSRPYEIPIPNFVTMRIVAQTLAQRTHCYLMLGQPEKALRELALLNDSRRITERAPTGKPMTLVDAMVNAAITGLYVNTIADGLQKNAWREPQLVALQKQLAEINLAPFVAQAFETEPAGLCRTLETASLGKIMSVTSGSGSHRSVWQNIRDVIFNKYNLVPRGWGYQNMVLTARLGQPRGEGFDLANNLILPGKFKDLARQMDAAFSGNAKPYNFLAAIGNPNITKATQTLAHNQTLVNEAQIVCALERCRLAYGGYPPTLDALVPQFIEKLPHDIIGGQPLHYRRTDPPSQSSGTASGKFLLYSVGWNEKDDGGQIVFTKGGAVDREKGDWVWQCPLK